MPEGLEAEIYRRAATRVVGRPVEHVAVDARQEMATEIRRELAGRSIVGARRIGKVVLLDLDGPADADEADAACGVDGAGGRRGAARVLGLHFGMTGRLVVDGEAPIDELTYSSGRDDPAWDRLTLRFADGGVLRVNDPRRWATFTLDPDATRLGPDFMDVDVAYLVAALARRRRAVKSALLDQSLVAGFGNMCVDEILWQAGIAPTLPARELGADGIERLVSASRRHLPAMLARGGSHRGTIDPEVRAGVPPCPRDGAPLRRDVVGGRTTIWCPSHQTTS